MSTNPIRPADLLWTIRQIEDRQAALALTAELLKLAHDIHQRQGDLILKNQVASFHTLLDGSGPPANSPQPGKPLGKLVDGTEPEPIVDPEKSPDMDKGLQKDPVSWSQRLLLYFIRQLGVALEEGIPPNPQNVPAEKQNAQKASGDRNNPVQTAEEKKFLQQIGEAVLKTSTKSPSESLSVSVNSKTVLTELALKLLTVHQLGQTLVARAGAKSLTQEALTHDHLFGLTSQFGKILTQIEQLKALAGEQKNFPPAKFMQIVAERLKELAAKIGSFGAMPLSSIPDQQQQVVLQRLMQEAEWLASLISMIKPDIASARDQTGLQKPSPNSLKEGMIHAQPPSLANKTNIPSLADEIKLPYNALEGGKPITLAVQAPRSAQEMAAMIQVHLSKGILQPLPLIVPYPVTFTFRDPLTEAQSNHRDKAGNESGTKKRSGGGVRDSSQTMVLIPPGPIIFGDPFDEGRIDEKPIRIEQLEAFLIATTPVTNSQFAAWLSEELLNKAIVIEHPGKIFDAKGCLLAMTLEAINSSQIELITHEGMLQFRASPTKENHPVVHVTHYGALAFCKANGLRLPTEIEWERAAGMMPTAYAQPLQKLRYGCPSDILNASHAIFRETSTASSKLNLTMPVGFFDGQKVYTKAGQRVETALSVTPWGCSDMSGNVREWTSSDFDEDGLFKITKGGSYNDTAFDLRVSAKIPLPPLISDAYTGFRVAL